MIPPPESLKRNLKRKFKRFSKKQLKKYYAEQMLLQPIVQASESHQIVRCCKCDEAKGLEFIRDGDDQMYYICHNCGFESQPLGPAPASLK